MGNRGESAGVVTPELVSELAREVVADASPAELPLFRATSAAYMHDPQSVLEPRRGREESLGFGVEAAVLLLTPAALQAARKVLEFLAAQVAGAAESEASDQIRRRLHHLVSRDVTPRPAGAALSREQLQRVRQIAFDAGIEAQLPEREANMVADSMVGRLALA
jgi:diphthamide synthase (EF-2-diphthine--ammonia ligase)